MSILRLEDRYNFNELITVSLNLLLSLKDTAVEVTTREDHWWYARYKGEFQNMGPKMRSLYWQKDRPWMHELKM